MTEEQKDKIHVYKAIHKEKIREYLKQYRINNKKKISEIRSRYQKKRRKVDKLFKLTKSIRSRISRNLKDKGYTKKSRTYEILGCTYEEFKIHLENQFINGMC